MDAAQLRKQVPPLGLLSPANADLYHRFEAEEAKTNHLRQKEKTQSTQLAALSAKLDELNTSLISEEEQCLLRTNEIKRELEDLDGEEASLDALMKQKKKLLQQMSSAVADIKVQLAYNFNIVAGQNKAQPTASPKQSSRRRSSTASGVFEASSAQANNASKRNSNDIVAFAETLSQDEMAEIFAESVFTDENGVEHRVIFSEGADEDDLNLVPGSPARGAQNRSNNASPAASPSDRKRKSVKDGKIAPVGAKNHCISNTAAKKAVFMLLEDARKTTTEQLVETERDYQNGGFLVDSVYANEVSRLQKQLDDVYQAMRSLLCTTPTALPVLGGGSTAPSSDRLVSGGGRTSKSSTKGKRHSSVAAPAEEEESTIVANITRVLSFRPTLSQEFASSLEKQKATLSSLKYQLQSEEALVADRNKYPSQEEWAKACKAQDHREFAQSRLEPERPQQPKEQVSAAERENMGNRGGAMQANESRKTPNRPPSATAQRSNVVPRPCSAPRMSRYATAASRALRSEGVPNVEAYEERYLQESSLGKPSGGTEYKFRTHQGLLKAIKSRQDARTRVETQREE